MAVAPLAGAWVEMLLRDFKNAFGEKSLPSRERGLKSESQASGDFWVCRSPRGSVG